MSDSIADTTSATPVVTGLAIDSSSRDSDPKVEKGNGREEERENTETTPEPTVDPLDKKGDPKRPHGSGDS